MALTQFFFKKKCNVLNLIATINLPTKVFIFKIVTFVTKIFHDCGILPFHRNKHPHTPGNYSDDLRDILHDSCKLVLELNDGHVEHDS